MIGPVDLRPDYLETVHRILAEYAPNAPVQVFGSRANWTAKPYSDLDLILRVGRLAPDDAALPELSDAFSESELPFKVDLILDTGKPSDFLSLVQGGAVPLPWPTTPLGALVPDDRSICYGVVQPGSPDPMGRPILRVNNFDSNGLNVASAMRISPDVEDQYRRSRLQGGELLVTLVGSVGLTAIAPPELEGWNVARAVGVVPLAADVDARWVNHMMRSGAVRAFMAMRSNTTVQTTFNLKDLAEIPIPMPPDRIRRPMSELLSALDDKIELNRRINETLEASARALFRDWFVDFGPTRAKAEGRPAYFAPDLWSHFPDRLGDDGVPEGWETFTVDALADQHTASINPALSSQEVFEHYSLPAFDSGASPALDTGSAIKSNKTIVPGGAVLLSKLNPEISRVWMTNDRDALRQIASTEFLAFTPKAFASRSLIFALFRDDAFRQIMEGMVTGTSKSHQRISPPGLRNVEALVGSTAVFAEFDRVVAPMVEAILYNRAEVCTLSATRDALLPKLMSGELRVRDAEALVA
ncbi:restriction endonuclease subunit S [Sphingomonas bacterium]|uniref:restriction endonuclease subunit S n=1 Tax=Sphingomonas bacterium TaxID=1895847 RepID=UPI0015772381|nr:restriction endonuclease subunit S [Sphingomonas bacterium]